MRSYTGTRKAVQDFYQGKRIAVPNSADEDFQDIKNGTQPVEVLFLSSPLPKAQRQHSYVGWWDLSSYAGQKNLYIVYVLNSGASFGWDTAFTDGCG